MTFDLDIWPAVHVTVSWSSLEVVVLG